MTFCIECGAKAPEAAKFCPQCGFALVKPEASKAGLDVPNKASQDAKLETEEPKAVELEETSYVETFETTSSEDMLPEEDSMPSEKHRSSESDALDVEAPEEKLIENQTIETTDASITDFSETENEIAIETAEVEESLNASSEAALTPPKSKAGLFMGLSLMALLAAGGGAYAMGLFDGLIPKTKIAENGPTAVAAKPEVTAKEAISPSEDTTENTVLNAYQAAIKSGRISDLGEFAQAHPENSLARDAETAAYRSLERQQSVLAFTRFTTFFPHADISGYTGPRSTEENQNGLEAPMPETTLGAIPLIRTSLTTRGEELDPFIAQGDTQYALSVIDEMLSTPDLNESEATYLLNLKAKAEAANGFIVSSEPASTPLEATDTLGSALENNEIFTIAAEPIDSAPVETLPVIETAPTPEAQTVPETQAVPEAPIFDVPAKPIERFGGITPDYATEPGECDMTFSINLSGAPTNIIADCSDPLFVLPAEETVTEWIYSPATLAGQPVQQDNIVVKLKFHLEDIE